jgi:hypothetical protein
MAVSAMPSAPGHGGDTGATALRERRYRDGPAAGGSCEAPSFLFLDRHRMQAREGAGPAPTRQLGAAARHVTAQAHQSTAPACRFAVPGRRFAVPGSRFGAPACHFTARERHVTGRAC